MRHPGQVFTWDGTCFEPSFWKNFPLTGTHVMAGPCLSSYPANFLTLSFPLEVHFFFFSILRKTKISFLIGAADKNTL